MLPKYDFKIHYKETVCANGPYQSCFTKTLCTLVPIKKKKKRLKA